MSQKTLHTPESRFREFMKVKEQLDKGYKVKEACKMANVPYSSYRRWRNKLVSNPQFIEQETIGIDSRRPKRSARQVSASTRQKVLDEADKAHHKSANSITKALKAAGLVISTAKVIEILEEEGLYGMIQIRITKGEYKRNRGLLRLCHKRQQGAQRGEIHQS